jgi:actin-related protein
LDEKEISLVTDNIILTGGNVLFPSFQERFCQDLRQWIPEDCPMQVSSPEQVIDHPWRGASRFATAAASDRKLFAESFVSKVEYEEHGHAYCNEKFYSCW